MYDLHRLGWKDFQQLCLTIVRETLGQTVESFLDSNDGGRDGAFAGTWSPSGEEVLIGRFVIQCKFTGRPGHSLTLSELSDERKKAKRLARQGLCDIYVLLTNAGLSGRRVEQIEESFKAAGVKHVLSLGADWICHQIRENKRLRMMVPRIYGLGDLTQILDERAYTHARALLANMRDELAKVVVTGAYRKAADALTEHGFVLLIGEPAAGKTTIAAMLAMAALDQWNASPLKLDTPDKVIEHWNPDESTQFFWLDDAFGVTQYEGGLVHGWNHILPQLQAMLRRGARIVMTSRNYIYERARKDLKEGAFPLLNEAQVVIDVHDLTEDEKKQILYNHLKLGKQSAGFRTQIKPFLEMIAAHPRFIPEIARRLGDPLFTKDLWVDEYYLRQFVERREQLLAEILTGLDADSKAALALIYMRSGRLESPMVLSDSEREALERLGSDLGRCRAALESLDGSLVQRIERDGDFVWQFKHPTIGDAYSSLLAQSSELLGVFVQGSTPEKLMGQITCGNVGIQGAVVIPRTLFPAVLARFEGFSSSSDYKTGWMASWGAKRQLQFFLASRCSKDFLSLYIAQHPEVLHSVTKPGLMLSAVTEVDLAIKLHALGLLPEEKRKAFVEAVGTYAAEGDDLEVLHNDRLRGVFSDEEFSDLVQRLRDELVPALADVRSQWQSNRGSDDEPGGHMAPLREGLEALGALLHDPAAESEVDKEVGLIDRWVAEQEFDDSDETPRRSLAGAEVSERFSADRSVFDDVDE